MTKSIEMRQSNSVYTDYGKTPAVTVFFQVGSLLVIIIYSDGIYNCADQKITPIGLDGGYFLVDDIGLRSVT